MTSREVIEGALRLEATARRPAALLSAGSWTLQGRGLTLERALAAGPAAIAEAIAVTNERVRSDIVWPGSGYHNLVLGALGAPIKFRAKGTPDVVDPLFRAPGDAGAIRLERLRDDRGIQALVGAAALLARSIGSSTVVGTSQWAPFTLGALAWGAEHMMRGVYRDKPAVHEVLAFAAEACFAYLEPFIEAGVSMISLADPTSSGDMVSRTQFVEFSLPWLAKVAARVKARGVRVLVHICGDTTSRLDDLAASGAEIVSVDHKVDLAAARRAFAGRVAFAGNLNPVAVLQAGTPDDVAAATEACLHGAGTEPGYVVMPGCDIPPTVPIENVRAMVETARAHPFPASEQRSGGGHVQLG